MKIAALVGSIRKESYNLKLARFIQKRYADKMDVEILNIKDLPYFNQDEELNPPEAAKQFKAKVKAADAALFVTPEYNYSVPGVLKNAIDWLSRVDQVMVGKPSWIVGASTGKMGTIRAQLHLRDILFAPGVSSPIMPGNEVLIATAQEKFDAEGNLIDEPTVQFLDQVAANFLKWFQTNK